MPRGGALAARVRAARGYADLDQPDLAKALAMSVQTYGRIESGGRPPTNDELDLIAATTKVPRPFLDSGFATQATTGVEQRLAVLEAQVSRLLLRAEAAGPPPPGGELGRRLRETEPSAGDPPQSGSDREADAR